MKIFVVLAMNSLLLAMAIRTVSRHRSDDRMRGLMDRAVMQVGLPIAVAGIVSIGWHLLVTIHGAPMYTLFIAIVPLLCAVGLWASVIFLKLLVDGV